MKDSIKRTVDDNDIRSLLMTQIKLEKKLLIETQSFESILVAKGVCSHEELEEVRNHIEKTNQSIQEINNQIEKLSVLVLYREGELSKEKKIEDAFQKIVEGKKIAEKEKDFMDKLLEGFKKNLS